MFLPVSLVKSKKKYYVFMHSNNVFAFVSKSPSSKAEDKYIYHFKSWEQVYLLLQKLLTSTHTTFFLISHEPSHTSHFLYHDIYIFSLRILGKQLETLPYPRMNFRTLSISYIHSYRFQAPYFPFHGLNIPLGTLKK